MAGVRTPCRRLYEWCLTMGRSPKYYADVHPIWASSLAMDGYTDKEIAQKMGISKSTLNNWKKIYPEFMDSLKKGKEPADAEVEQSLFKAAKGYEIEEKKVVIDQESKKAIRIETTVRHVPPNVTAAIFWLKNRRPDKWRDVNKIEHTGKDGQSLGVVEILKLPDNGRDSQ